MVRIGTIVLGVDDAPRAVAFWTAALDYVPRPGCVSDDWAILEPRQGPGVALAIDQVSTAAEPYPRTHLDLYAADADEQGAEVDRLIGLGATRVDWDRYPEDPDFVVLADPDGNRFCVIDTAHG